MTWNIYTCDNCKRQIIAEEKETHQCNSLKEYKFENDTLWVNDGDQWYPLNLKSNRSFTSRKTTADWTEPSNNNLIKYWYRTIRYG